MGLLLRYRLSLVVVGLAMTGTAGVFTFARPEYRSGQAQGTTLTFPEAKPPVHGWAWASGTPGFHFGEHHDAWNISLLKPAELVPAAHGAGILASIRTYAHGRPTVLFAKGRCIGAQPHAGPPTVLCPPALDHALALFVVEAQSGRRLSLIGIARAEVTRVIEDSPDATEVVMRGATRVVRPVGWRPLGDFWWGTFADSSAMANPPIARLRFYGAHGRVLAATTIRFAHPAERVVVLPY